MGSTQLSHGTQMVPPAVLHHSWNQRGFPQQLILSLAVHRRKSSHACILSATSGASVIHFLTLNCVKSKKRKHRAHVKVNDVHGESATLERRGDPRGEGQEMLLPLHDEYGTHHTLKFPPLKGDGQHCIISLLTVGS